jgi:hypothetical protein
MTPETRSALFGAIAGAVVSGLFSTATILYTDSISHKRSADIQTVLTFTDRGFPLADLAAKYISAVTNRESLDDLKHSIRGEVAQEISASETLRPMLEDNETSLDDYQHALVKFTKTLDDANSPTHMRPWVEAFGRAADARRQLSLRMREQAGI